jgi:hypothetical protein
MKVMQGDIKDKRDPRAVQPPAPPLLAASGSQNIIAVQRLSPSFTAGSF